MTKAPFIFLTLYSVPLFFKQGSDVATLVHFLPDLKMNIVITFPGGDFNAIEEI